MYSTGGQRRASLLARGVNPDLDMLSGVHVELGGDIALDLPTVGSGPVVLCQPCSARCCCTPASYAHRPVTIASASQATAKVAISTVSATASARSTGRRSGPQSRRKSCVRACIRCFTGDLPPIHAVVVIVLDLRALHKGQSLFGLTEISQIVQRTEDCARAFGAIRR